jgi:AAA15 family ATPase/GTPase
VYNWFRDTVELVAPDSRFAPFERFLDDGHPLYAKMNTMLSQLDTGIAHLGGEAVPFVSIPFTEPIKAKIQEDVRDNATIRMVAGSSGNRDNQRIAITRIGGDFTAKKLVAYHEKKDGAEVKFDISQESDGSQRVIDLLPAILELSSPETKKVYIIDEIDRSLHTLLTRSLLKNYLSNCSTVTRSQLLFTTHDVLLMDQDLLRLDEMWVAERDDTGGSTLISFCEYKDANQDKDIRKSYLRGKLGGIPNIFLTDVLVNRGSREKSEEDN